MTITTELAIAIAVVGIVLYVICFWTVKTKVASIPARPTESSLPTATAGVNLSHERRRYRMINLHMFRTFTTVTN